MEALPHVSVTRPVAAVKLKRAHVNVLINRRLMTSPVPAQKSIRSPVEPIIELDGGFSAFDVWRECHAAHQFWQKNHENGVTSENRLQSVLRICKRLSSFPAQRLAAAEQIGFSWIADRRQRPTPGVRALF